MRDKSGREDSPSFAHVSEGDNRKMTNKRVAQLLGSRSGQGKAFVKRVVWARLALKRNILASELCGSRACHTRLFCCICCALRRFRRLGKNFCRPLDGFFQEGGFVLHLSIRSGNYEHQTFCDTNPHHFVMGRLHMAAIMLHTSRETKIKRSLTCRV